jgi:hypothetical protein
MIDELGPFLALFGPFWKYPAKIRPWICKANYFTRLFLSYAAGFWPAGNTAVLSL